ncbi:metallophosphoesterase [Paenibacillus sp. R14(2021)]|uniref:metallophosphoesterase n=1 Tax=Paenibacillus sp. R14(2021) TaxID=2859228 RepID=UPI0021573A25|nr:metallophosphoesterase [Paenibacillus sp. R14(2021)]
MNRITAAGGTDLVLIGGDLREKSVPLERSRHNLRQLARIAPVYMVYGNHDYDEDIRMLDVLLNEERVRVLVNESVVLEQRDGSRIRLAGVDDPRTNRENLKLALRDEEDGRGELFTVLLAHDPILAKRMGAEAEHVDLILSGHTHGGQIVLPWVGPIWLGEEASGYWRGWFDVKKRTTGNSNSRLFVSSGLGTSRLPMRLLTEAQVHRIILRSARSAGALDQSSRDQ